MKEPSASSVALHTLFAEAVRLHQAGRLAEAERLYRQVLAADPRHADSLHLLGLLAYQVGRCAAAVELIGRAIDLRDGEPHYYNNLGNALHGLGKLDEAVASYDRAIALKPDLPDAHYNRANTLQAEGRLDEAVASHDRALSLRPDFAPSHNNRANVLQAQGKLAEAVAGYDRAIALEPDYADAHSNRANALRDQGRLGEAMAAYDRTLAIRPDYAEAHNNRAAALKDQGRLAEAVASYDRAIALKPDYADAYSNRGNALKDQGRIDEALASYDRALAIMPQYAEGHGNLLMGLHYSARFSGADILARARQFASACEAPVPQPAFSNSPMPTRRLRVGYVSGDFVNHPVSYFLSSLLANHDHDAVEVFCYSNRAVGDDMTDRLRRSADHWQGIAGIPDARVAAAIRRDQVDILVDLSGHTARNRLLLFTHRPAPVQVTWLGYFGTTGLSSIDYILADRYVVKGGEETCFTEKVARLPESYLCFSPPSVDCLPGGPPSLRGNPITFGNFNYHAKTSPEAIALWSRILQRVPGSRLLLKTRSLADAAVRRRLLEGFAGHGIAADRLGLEGAAPRTELLRAYNRVDVALDPTPYGGGTTTVEALWMGVPVVTLSGNTWVGRVSESIVATVGLPELVARSPDEYVDAAAQLATNSSRLAKLHSQLRPRLETSALCNAGQFARHLEQAYRRMWQSWCARANESDDKGPSLRSG